MPSPTTRTNSWNIAKQQDSKTLKLRQIPGSYHTILLHIHNALCAFVARPDEALGHLSFSPPNGEKLKGDESLNFLKDELKGYGPVVLLNYGSGSVCDYSKAVAASVYYEGDYWDKFWLKQEQPAADQRLLPVACILTMAGTGSEMNAGTVITDAEHTFKVGHVFDSRLMPKFSILNPRFTMTVPENLMKAGIYDIMNHIMEQYFSDFDDNTSDYIAEDLMRSVIHSSRIAVKNPQEPCSTSWSRNSSPKLPAVSTLISAPSALPLVVWELVVWSFGDVPKRLDDESPKPLIGMYISAASSMP